MVMQEKYYFRICLKTRFDFLDLISLGKQSGIQRNGNLFSIESRPGPQHISFTSSRQLGSIPSMIC